MILIMDIAENIHKCLKSHKGRKRIRLVSVSLYRVFERGGRSLVAVHDYVVFGRSKTEARRIAELVKEQAEQIHTIASFCSGAVAMAEVFCLGAPRELGGGMWDVQESAGTITMKR